VAAAWVKRFEEDNAEALCDLVNALLKAAGCDEKITEHDIEDVDNISDKLSDISEEYQNVRAQLYIYNPQLLTRIHSTPSSSILSSLKPKAFIISGQHLWTSIRP